MYVKYSLITVFFSYKYLFLLIIKAIKLTTKTKIFLLLANHLLFLLRKGKYHCNFYKKRFFESDFLLPKYHRITNRLSAFVLINYEINLFVSTVIQIFDVIQYPKSELYPQPYLTMNLTAIQEVSNINIF